MNFKQQIAKHISADLKTSQLPELAMFGIEEGYKSDSLYILAGMNEKDNAFEIHEYFEKAVTELNLELPNKRNASLEYAAGLVHDILNEEMDIIKGVSEIVNDAIHSFDFYSESKKYCYDSIGFEKIYGLYDSYDDLLNPLCERDANESIELLKVETRTELMVELKKWNQFLLNRL